jgi:sn-glycerol 3-phosphate transport system substrate-binding protein
MLGGLSGAALLASCGETQATPTPVPAAGTAASPTPTAPAVVQSPGSKVTVVYWGSFSGNLGEAEQGMVKRFNESQDEVEVEYQFQGNYEETAQKLTQALAAGTTPDITLLSDVWWFKFYLNDVLLPLNDLFSAAGIDTTDYVDPLIEEGTRQGVIHWVPFARSTPLFYYNKQVWQETGLPDRGPATWAEFLEWTPKLVKKEGDKTVRYAFAHPSAASYIAWLFQPVVWQHGGRYSDPDFTIRIQEDPAIEAGQLYLASVRDGWAVPTKDLNAEFVNGGAAAMMASTAALRGITNAAAFPVGTAFLPEGPKGFGCCTGGAGLAILKDKPKEIQQAAFKYLAFATSPEHTMWWSQNTGYMPVRKSATASPEMQRFYQENPNFKTAVEQLPKTRPQDAARVWIPNGDQIIGKGLERVTVQLEDPATVFADVATTLEREAKPVIEQLKRREG